MISCAVHRGDNLMEVHNNNPLGTILHHLSTRGRDSSEHTRQNTDPSYHRWLHAEFFLIGYGWVQHAEDALEQLIVGHAAILCLPRWHLLLRPLQIE